MIRTQDKVSSSIAWVWALSLVLVPILYLFVVSFLSRGTYGGITYVASLANYEKVFDPLFLNTLLRSLFLALCTTVCCILLSYPLSLFLVFRAGKFKEVLFYLLIIPFWTNFLIRTYAWVVILGDNGWLNSTFQLLGLDFSLNWLFTPQAVLIGMVYNYVPYMAMSLYVSLEKMDQKLLEAASDLGAGPVKRFWKVTFPMSVPGLIAGSVMVFIPSMGEYVIPDVLGGGQTVYVGNLLGNQFLTLRNWPLGSAMSCILVLMIFGIIQLFEKSMNQDDMDELI